MPAEYLFTSRLGNVIELFSLGQRTGILRAVRGSGAAREMGQIRFVQGRPESALIGHVTGMAAVNVLRNWGECYYLFEDAALGEQGELIPQEQIEPGSAYGNWPSGDSGWSSWSGPPSPPAELPPLGQSGGSWPAYSPPGYAPPGYAPPGYAPPGYTPPNPPTPRPPTPPSAPFTRDRPASQPGTSGSSAGTPSPAHAGGSAAALPRRTTRSELEGNLPLDQRERMVLLLVDGRRSVPDLARLTRRMEDEVRAILGNLKMLGLIE